MRVLMLFYEAEREKENVCEALKELVILDVRVMRLNGKGVVVTYCPVEFLAVEEQV